MPIRAGKRGSATKLSEFKEFYDAVSNACCVYKIEDVKGDKVVVHSASENTRYDDTGRTDDIVFKEHSKESKPFHSIKIEKPQSTVRV